MGSWKNISGIVCGGHAEIHAQLRATPARKKSRSIIDVDIDVDVDDDDFITVFLPIVVLSFL